METIKTAVVIVVLLGILYGVYMVLNKPEIAPPPEAAWQTENASPPQVELGKPASLGAPQLAITTEPNALSRSPAQVDAASADRNVPQGTVTALAEAPAARRWPTPATEDVAASPPSRLPVQEVAASLDEPQSGLAPATFSSPQRELPSSAVVETAVLDRKSGAGSAGAARPNNLHFNDNTEAPILRAFDSAWRSAVGQLQRKEWTEALLTLSLFYNDPELSGEERQRLIDLLDPLAGKVIYSTEHTLEAPWDVRPGETLYEVAERHQVPVGLLQNINGIADPRTLPPGAKLKVVRGPFRAEIDLNKSELAIFRGKYYAGRFPVSIGNDPPPKPAEYEVLAKQQGRDYQTRDGARLPARATDNPYGNVWIDLGDNMALHGSPDAIPVQGGLGCISLTAADAADVFNILVVGSKVAIR